jgi:carbamoyl-phosphate synthase small subunit
MNKVFLYLEDGQKFEAESFAYECEHPILSEVVFNTSMQGYQEVITDPSYCDQSVIMTYPLIGNYGINQDDSESIAPCLKVLIVREICTSPSNFRSRQSLPDFLINNNIVGIHNIDTRRLTKIIREKGTMKSIVSMKSLDESERNALFQKNLPEDQIQKVSTKAISHFPSNGGKRIVLIDFGYKKNILESLIKRGCDVIVVPFNTPYEKIREFNPQGILLSNGPGDPKSIIEVIPTIQKLQSDYPIFAICMGHQIFALANGANTHKMKFGHRGGNHPVKDLELNKVFITSQNHGYCVDHDSIKTTQLEVTQINLNDKTIEGLKHKSLPCFSVQYHPEASPGPNDTKYLFEEFINLMETV